MTGSIKIRAKAGGDFTEVKVLIKHPMEPGIRKNSETGELIPAHYIQEVTCEYNGKAVIAANWGPAVSKNPFCRFKFKGGEKGDKIKISWVDNQGETDALEAEIQGG